jgi:hypothetical protein
MFMPDFHFLVGAEVWGYHKLEIDVNSPSVELSGLLSVGNGMTTVVALTVEAGGTRR